MQLLPLVVAAATAAALFVMLRSPRDWGLDVGAAGDERYAAYFSVAEMGEGGASFRWSTPKSRLMLHGSWGGAHLFSLRLHGDQRTLNAASRWSVQLERGEQRLAAMRMLPGWRVYRLLLPAGVTRAGLETAPLALVSSSYHTHKGRNMGVALDWLRLAPLDGAGGGAPVVGFSLWWTLLFGWGVALLAGWAWRLDGLLLRGAPRHRAVRVHLLVVLVALALVGWAWRSPSTLAWALPPLPWSLAFLTLIFLLTMPSLRLSFPPVLPCSVPDISPRAALAGLGSVFVLALVLRFYRIDELPFGLWRDEANHGLIALRILEDSTYRPVYNSSINMPSLGFYPFALAIKLVGIHIWSMRLITALAGALTVFPLYGLVGRLVGRRDVALLAAAFLAGSSWHITLSRFSFPTVFEPPLALAGLWLMLVGMERLTRDTTPPLLPAGLRSLAFLVVAGLCLGLAAQHYHTGRVVPVVGGVLALLLLVRGAWWRRRWLAGMAAVGVGFALAVAPLAVYALSEPDAFNQRVGRVFLLREAVQEGRAPLAAFDDSLGRHLLMFNVRGDSNGRHHAPGAPLLDGVTGVGFVVGCGVLLVRWRAWYAAFLLLATGLEVAPSLLAVAGPHAMRSFGAAAFACAIAAVGWVVLASKVQEGVLIRGVARWLLPGVAVLALALNGWTYFVAMPENRAVWLSFYPVHTRAGGYVRELANREGAQSLRQVYVEEKLKNNSVFAYLAHGLPVQTFDDEALVCPSQPGAHFIVSGYNTRQENLDMLAPCLGHIPTLVTRGPNFPGTREASFLVYQAVSEEGR